MRSGSPVAASRITKLCLLILRVLNVHSGQYAPPTIASARRGAQSARAGENDKYEHDQGGGGEFWESVS